MIREAFARRLRALLKEKRISRLDLARRVEVETEDVARWLGGSLPIRRTMKRIAEALQVSPDWLEGGAGNRDTRGIERQTRGGARPPAQGPTLRRAPGPKNNEASQDVFAIYADQAREAIKIFDELIWLFSRLATETEARAEEFREKLRELRVYREKRREEVAARHPELASSVRQISAWPIPDNLDDLLDRVRAATSVRGQKKALAQFLDVSSNKVSDWLAKPGRKRPIWRPGGEPTLRMLAWLKADDEGAHPLSKR